MKGIYGIAFNPPAAEGCEHRRGESFSAVSDRAEIDFAVGREAFLYCLSDLGCRERTFEFIVGNKDAHDRPEAVKRPSF
jgi:hypothetical protein